jgi:hypothetical protein
MCLVATHDCHRSCRYNIGRFKEALSFVGSLWAWFRDLKAWRRPWCAAAGWSCFKEQNFAMLGNCLIFTHTHTHHTHIAHHTHHTHTHSHTHGHDKRSRYNLLTVVAAYFVCFHPLASLLAYLILRSAIALRRLLRQVCASGLP